VRVCRCGSTLGACAPGLRCVNCGLACCPACSYVLGTAACCTRCAESVLAARGASLGPAAPAPPSRSWTGPEPATPPPAADTSHWLILVALDEPDLFAHLARSFAGDDKVKVILDRGNLAAAHHAIEERLRLRGVAVLKRHPR
jgi:hypothetical protein